MKRTPYLFLLGLLCWISFQSTSQNNTSTSKKKPILPNYEVVFPQNRVNTLEITLTKATWDSVQTDMKKKFGNEFGKGSRFPGPMPKNGAFPPPMGGVPMGGGPAHFGQSEPEYVSASLKFNGKNWNSVGFRLKGNSTLMMSWGQGIYKLPFRLSFDKFSPKGATKPSFYGFHELAMSPAANDPSLLHEKVAADLFRQGGVPAAQTAFYRVFINFGEGLKYCGVYTMVEVIDDTMVGTQFGDTKGNIYKPESTFQQFNQAQFEKKNNKKQADYSDVRAFVAALNDSIRLTSPAQWRSQLEATFNVDHFLKYLAINNVIGNWDTYGAMAHNFYLYNSPTKKLTWIPWDNNEALSNRGGGGMFPSAMARNESSAPSEGFFPPPPMGGKKGGFGGNVSLDLSSVSKQWPLIRYLADDPVYFVQYKNYVKEFTQHLFTTTNMKKLLERQHRLIAPYVEGQEVRPYSQLRDVTNFGRSLEQLNQYVASQRQKVEAFLQKP
ncbi:CotH kinase family protein [Runella sp. SP2]|uniref:CotH kinase family protein n=1 Tax=Runella sp. SP2 TaxID=2268026 RepID=UPI000F0953D8|nr:CotH kinase family protein [Runella sp. SP2]AYQ35149.1 spore coat protein CotH [Runella sp. SP2]